MSIEAKAGHDAVAPKQRRTAEQHAYDYESNKARLVADLKTLVADMETLIKEAAGSPADGFAMLRTRFAGKLAETKASIERAGAAVGEKTRYATDATHAYVKENPWQSAGFLVAAGVILGFFIGRRSAAIVVDDSVE